MRSSDWSSDVFSSVLRVRSSCRWYKMILHARRTGRDGSWLPQDMRWSEVSASCIGHALPCPPGPSSPTRFLRARRQHRLRPDQAVHHDLLYLALGRAAWREKMWTYAYTTG